MMYQVTAITFDLSTDDDSIPDYVEDQLHHDLNHQYIGTQWVADDEDDLVEEITNHSGWCISHIDYVEV
jgi:hypothetical protein